MTTNKCPDYCRHETHCPYCGVGISYTKCSDYELNGDGKTTVVECDCGNIHTITMRVMVNYEADKLPEKCCGTCDKWKKDRNEQYCENYWNRFEESPRKCWRSIEEIECKNYNQVTK